MVEKFNIIKSDIPGAKYGVCSDENSTRGGCAALVVENLSLSYGKIDAFKNVSLTVSPCSITSIIGPSGCGKTSFLKSLNRLHDLTPTAKISGKIQMGKINVLSSQCDTLNLRRRVGMIFQKPSPFPFSIHKNIDLPLKEYGIKSRAKRNAKIEQSLKAVGLWEEVKDRLSSSALNLSGGQQQRLCIARAIALEPEVILMDEPCSALDPIASRVVEDLILSLRGDYTVIVVTHNLAQAKRISDDVAFFWHRDGSGYLVEHGEARLVFSESENPITQAYIAGVQG